MIISPLEDIHQTVPFIEHIMDGIVLLRFGQQLFVGRHTVEFLSDYFHDRLDVFLSPLKIIPFGPTISSYLMLMFEMIDMIDEPDDHLGVKVVAAVKELPLYMLEAGHPGQPPRHLSVRREAV